MSPSLTEQPPTFYAEVGSSEDTDRLTQAQNGRYSVWVAETDTSSHHIFVETGDIPSTALARMVHILRDRGESRPSIKRETLKSLKSIGMNELQNRKII